MNLRSGSTGLQESGKSCCGCERLRARSPLFHRRGRERERERTPTCKRAREKGGGGELPGGGGEPLFSPRRTALLLSYRSARGSGAPGVSWSAIPARQAHACLRQGARGAHRLCSSARHPHSGLKSATGHFGFSD